MMPVVWHYGILVILISRYCSDDVYLLIFAAYCMTAEWCRSLNSFHCRNWMWKCFFFSSQTLALRIVSACCGAFVSSIRTEQCCCCWGVFSKWECVAAGHDNNMVATKLECKCHSGLSYDVTTSSSAVCLQIQKCYNTAVCKGADWTWQRRFSTWRGGGGNCGVSKRTGPHRSWSDWSIFYKSSSARHEKTRPVAILSTTLQPYFRFHLNATCAVFVRTDTGEELRKKKWAEINFGGSFLRSAYLQMFLKSYR